MSQIQLREEWKFQASIGLQCDDNESAKAASETEIMHTDPMMIERRNWKWAQARQGRPGEGWLVGSCLTLVKAPYNPS